MGTPAYDKANTTRINLKLNNKTDADIIQHLESTPNMQGYIKKLIREDMTMTICSGYTPDGISFRLILEDHHLYIVTKDGKDPFNDEWYEADDDYALRSAKDSLISDGYRI